MILVLGASGFIGRAIYDGLKKESLDVAGTYFKNAVEGMYHFDIDSSRIEEIDFKGKEVEYVVIAAAATVKKIDDSKVHWKSAYKTNVTKTKKLIDDCFSNGIVLIYISTDNVFDGKKGGYKETDPRMPINCYGRIKYEMEDYIFGVKRPWVVLRMGKTFGVDIDDDTIITSMVRDMRDGKRMQCVNDQQFTPLYIGDLVNFVKVVINRKYTGVFHLASTKPVSHYGLAQKIKEYFTFAEADIIPISIDSLETLDNRTRLIDLDISKYKEATGKKEEEIEYYLEMIKQNL